MFLTNLSNQTVKALRQCDLPAGAEFVRCGRGLTQAQACAIAADIRLVLGDTNSQVFWAWHDTVGDYVRVNRGSAAFDLICKFKS